LVECINPVNVYGFVFTNNPLVTGVPDPNGTAITSHCVLLYPLVQVKVADVFVIEPGTIEG
jgi:hypothetical protein